MGKDTALAMGMKNQQNYVSDGSPEEQVQPMHIHCVHQGSR